ncbi:MAG: M14 metallopeptidase family protein [Sphingobacteriales bacterium]
MLKKLLFSIVLFGFAAVTFAQQIQSPSEFLGYKLGSQFTPHHRIVEYFRYVAEVSKNMKLMQYGTTNEGRPLLAMFIASDENVTRLEDIRQHNLWLAGQSETNPALKNAPVIVWMSYNVHGNEPSSSEAAMQALFDFADPSNTRTKPWLNNTVVVIDPCLNPDGRERYINFYRSVAGAVPNPDPAAREHSEPWPGGRVNHYYFDLNRDWAWQTQKETKARVALYNQWLPEVHVDFHEQGYNSPYYFAPAAEPFHRDITAWQREFQTIIGKNNAKYFDKNGWLYYTHEIYDLLYPSYGDTYPIYNGSIGMTYEQGGIGAGLAIMMNSGDTLTLAKRIDHHLSNSLSTVEIASLNANKALDEFKKYFDNARTNPPGDYKTYVIKNDNQDNINLLGQLLKRNGIKYGFGVKAKATGYNYVSGKNEEVDIDSKDMVVTAYQPKAVLLNVLLEPKTMISDSDTYDITAWSLPYAYGLKAYGVKEIIKPGAKKVVTVQLLPPPPLNTYAYASTWGSLYDVKFLAELLRKGIKVRSSEKPFEINGQKFAAGSLIITREGNGKGFDTIVFNASNDCHRSLTPLSSGFMEKGADIGSHSMHFIHPPRVMLVTGDGVSAEAMGEVWYFFEKEIDYPVTLVKYHDLNRIKWADFDVAIFPDGNYDDLPADRVQSWVRDGGKLIAMESTISQLVDKKGFSIKAPKDDKPKEDTAKNNPSLIKLYADRDHESIRSNVPGAIYKVDMDNSHPLGFGLSKYYFTLKLNDIVYNYLGDDGWNVGTIKKNAYVAGFVGQKSKEKIKNGLLFGVQSLGRGSVVYLVDDPLFRSFWQNGKLLFGNAVFMVGQ